MINKNIFPAIILSFLCIVFFAIIYPFTVWGIAQFLPNKGNGEKIINNGKTYYANIGQLFTEDQYFQSRPSAVAYNAAGSGGSNKSAANPDYLTELRARIDTILVHNPGLKKSDIPVDLITSSGSGLDPHISVQAAKVQVKRIANERNITEDALQKLIIQHIEKPLLGMFGPEKINVLNLNLALDNL